MSAQFIAAIQRALDLTDGGADAMGPLAAVVASPDDASRRSALIRLAAALNSGASPGVLAAQLDSRSTVLNPFRYEREGGWAYGTHYSRRQIVDALWADAGDDAPAGVHFARAAFLLAAEQGFPYGVATMAHLLGDQDFSSRTRWGPPQVAAVRALLEAERRRTGEFVEAAAAAATAIDAMIARPNGMDEAQVLRFLAATEQMAQQAEGRSDVQMRLANLVWRVVNVARGRGRADVVEQLRAAAARWTATIESPHLSRWLDEVLNSPPRQINTAGARRLKRSQLRLRHDP